MDGRTDFLDELDAERTAANPEFPAILAAVRERIIKCPGCESYVRPAEAFERPHDPAYHLVTREPPKATAPRL